MVYIYHNPRCSKSRQTLALLQEKGIKPVIIEYLKTPPTKTELKNVLKYLAISARELIRHSEAEYQAHQLANDKLSDDELVDFMLEYPKLIQRPIVINGEKAAIGRPPEQVLEIL